jgi:DNA-binding transcriptional ArsR family regulator
MTEIVSHMIAVSFGHADDLTLTQVTGACAGTMRQKSPPIPRIGAPLLSARATRLLAAAVLCLDADGTICATDCELAERAGVSRPTVQRAWRELEAQGLVHCSGRTRGVYRYVDPRVCKALERAVSRRSHDVGWREVRARNGGLQRALKAALRDLEATRKAAERAKATHTPPPQLEHAVSVLRAGARHALTCVDGPDYCDRCLRLQALCERDTTIDEIAEVKL